MSRDRDYRTEPLEAVGNVRTGQWSLELRGATARDARFTASQLDDLQAAGLNLRGQS